MSRFVLNAAVGAEIYARSINKPLCARLIRGRTRAIAGAPVGLNESERNVMSVGRKIRENARSAAPEKSPSAAASAVKMRL